MLRVLIIDDEEDTLLLLKTILQRKGFEVNTVSTGRYAVNAATEYKPDVVLLDIKLDEPYDGRDICRELKANEHTRNSKIFLCSAHVTKTRNNLYNEDGFIQKPFDINAVVEKINCN